MSGLNVVGGETNITLFNSFYSNVSKEDACVCSPFNHSFGDCVPTYDSFCIYHFGFFYTQQNRGVMVTLKKCKFLQLCGHQIGVQLTLPSCIFTPKWCKYDLHTILNAFKNTFEVLQQH